MTNKEADYLTLLFKNSDFCIFYPLPASAPMRFSVSKTTFQRYGCHNEDLDHLLINLMTLKPIIMILMAATLTQGCANHWLNHQPQDEKAGSPVAKQSDQQIPERPFPIETFYALMVAELAGSRERYDIALGNYMQQAEQTRDPDIAARATYIARYLNARKAALTSALLWVEISPEDPEAHAIAAAELTFAGQLLEATEHARFLLQQQGGPTLYQSIAARAAAISSDERQPLIKHFQQQLQNHPDNLELLIGTSLLLQQENNDKLALDYARQALKLDPSLVSAAVLQARLLNSLGKPKEAIASLATILSTQPDDTRLRLQYARLLATTDLKKAQHEFQTLLKQTPDDPEIMFSLALVYYEQELLEEADQLFQRLSHLEQQSSTAHYYLGRIALRNRDWQSALEHLLRVEPGAHFMPALLQTTEILVSAGQADSANKRLNAARERFPDEAERFYLLEAEVLSKHQQLEQAETILNEALSQYPSSTKLLYSRAMINEQLDRLDRLETDLKTILQYDPDNATALNALGYTLADRTDRYPEALQLITKALQLKPEDPAIMDSMGWVQYRMGNYQTAIEYLRQAMKAYPDAEIAAHLGEVLWVSGAQEQARNAWSQGLRLDPDSGIILDTMERLNAFMPATNTP